MHTVTRTSTTRTVIYNGSFTPGSSPGARRSPGYLQSERVVRAGRGLGDTPGATGRPSDHQWLRTRFHHQP